MGWFNDWLKDAVKVDSNIEVGTKKEQNTYEYQTSDNRQYSSVDNSVYSPIINYGTAGNISSSPSATASPSTSSSPTSSQSASQGQGTSYASETSDSQKEGIVETLTDNVTAIALIGGAGFIVYQVWGKKLFGKKK